MNTTTTTTNTTTANTKTANTKTTQDHASQAHTTHSSMMPLICAALMGVALIIGAGHVQTETLHGAAHDARHAAGFPCH